MESNKFQGSWIEPQLVWSGQKITWDILRSQKSCEPILKVLLTLYAFWKLSLEIVGTPFCDHCMTQGKSELHANRKWSWWLYWLAVSLTLQRKNIWPGWNNYSESCEHVTSWEVGFGIELFAEQSVGSCFVLTCNIICPTASLWNSGENL